MTKKIFIFLVLGMFTLRLSGVSFAMMCGDHSERQHLAQAHSEHEHGTTEAVKKAVISDEAVNVGNKICPVSQEKIDDELRATYEYEGKIYNFCCASCIDEFKKDPEKYINKIEQQLKNEQEHPSATAPQHSH